MSTRAAFVLTLLACASVEGARPARFALAIGSNDGGPSRLPLWFAERDAERFASALIELGEFERDQVTVLAGPTADQLRSALQKIRLRSEEALARGELPLLLLYYSGHADPHGLLLARERLPYPELTALLSEVGQGIRIAIVDACHSGALTQAKGARRAPLDFEIPAEPRADGVAIITSASATEAAQESAALRGSFFTHHLTLGLRGAADADADGRVTLAEAYRYAYHRTLVATSAAGIAPQHPTYALQLAGKGEVVLADLRQVRSSLAFPARSGHRYLVTTEKTMEVVAELESPPSRCAWRCLRGVIASIDSSPLPGSAGCSS
jgi:hypothetical protein